MKILVDTNVLISAFVFGGKTQHLVIRLLKSSHKLLISEYVQSEFKEKLFEKWPLKAQELFNTAVSLPFDFCKSAKVPLGVVRDEKDIPVLNDAIFNDADAILTGDKDFFELDIIRPQIFSPAMMMDFLSMNDEKKNHESS